jgi:hypothetical protein
MWEFCGPRRWFIGEFPWPGNCIVIGNDVFDGIVVDLVYLATDTDWISAVVNPQLV